MAEELKIKSDETSCLKMSLEEVSKKLKEFEEGRPNVFLSVPSIFSIPKPPPIDVIEQPYSENNHNSNETSAGARSFSHFEMEKSDSTQSSVDAFNDIVKTVQTGSSKCPDNPTESNTTPITVLPDITDSQPDSIDTASNAAVQKTQEQSDAVIAETAQVKSKPEKGPPRSRKRKATASCNTSRPRNVRKSVSLIMGQRLFCFHVNCPRSRRLLLEMWTWPTRIRWHCHRKLHQQQLILDRAPTLDHKCGVRDDFCYLLLFLLFVHYLLLYTQRYALNYDILLWALRWKCNSKALLLYLFLLCCLSDIYRYISDG
ncbi:hypothetical protein V1509DRAFT_491641 [Lipomyces kononenkoae]